jgi:hypothetical protein
MNEVKNGRREESDLGKCRKERKEMRGGRKAENLEERERIRNEERWKEGSVGRNGRKKG